jgi:hypothetical protein
MATLSAFFDSGLTVAAVIRDDAQQFANTATELVESYNAANIASYAIAATEIGATGEYRITFPGWLAAGHIYSTSFAVRAGASLTVADLADRFSTKNWYWDGVNLVQDCAAKLAMSATPITGSMEEKASTLMFDASNNVLSSPQTEVTVDSESVAAIQAGLATSEAATPVNVTTENTVIVSNGS